VSIEFNPIPIQSGGNVVPMEQNQVGGAAVNYVPFIYNSRAYMLTQLGSAVTNLIRVFKSALDCGSWTLLDGANSPHLIGGLTLVGSSVFDGNHTVTVAYKIAAGPGALIFRDFDLSTETWGADYGTVGSPTVRTINQTFLRSNGSKVVLHNTAPNPGGLSASIFAGGVWSTTYNVDTNATNFPNGSSAAVMDANDIIHIFMRTAGQNATYQQILANDTLGQFNNFTSADFGVKSWQMTNPIIVGANLIFGVVDPTSVFSAVLVGTPVAAPVFTLSGDIDPDGNFDYPNGNFPSLAYDGATIYGVNIPTAGALRVGRTTNLTAPGSDWIWEDLDDSLGNIEFPAVGNMALNRIFGMYQVSDPITGFQNLNGNLILFPGLPDFVQVNASSLPVIPLPNPAGKCP
jgi:hypothetical protein